jgi:hypothetical protein
VDKIQEMGIEKLINLKAQISKNENQRPDVLLLCLVAL